MCNETGNWQQVVAPLRQDEPRRASQQQRFGTPTFNVHKTCIHYIAISNVTLQRFSCFKVCSRDLMPSRSRELCRLTISLFAIIIQPNQV